MNTIIELLNYPFMQRAIICGIAISFCAALIGVILVLKNYSMIGHGLGEVGFAALSLALVFNLPEMSVAIPIVIIASFIILLIAMYAFFYNRLFMITFDEKYAKVCGINVTFYQFLISLITAIVVVLGMRMMGTLLISSLIVFPAIIARKLTNSFKNMVILSVLISVICFIFGILISYYLNLPTGACIVAVYIVSLLIANIFKKIKI